MRFKAKYENDLVYGLQAVSAVLEQPPSTVLRKFELGNSALRASRPADARQPPDVAGRQGGRIDPPPASQGRAEQGAGAGRGCLRHPRGAGLSVAKEKAPTSGK